MSSSFAMMGVTTTSSRYSRYYPDCCSCPRLVPNKVGEHNMIPVQQPRLIMMDRRIMLSRNPRLILFANTWSTKYAPGSSTQSPLSQRNDAYWKRHAHCCQKVPLLYLETCRQCTLLHYESTNRRFRCHSIQTHDDLLDSCFCRTFHQLNQQTRGIRTGHLSNPSLARAESASLRMS